MKYYKFFSYIKSSKGTGLLILISALVLFSSGICRSTIYVLDESKNAQCAWEMMHSSDKITPTFNGEIRTDKPPLHYYFMMAGYLILGKSAAGARIFSSIAGALLLWALFHFTNRYCGRSTALWTIAVLFASILWTVEFHIAVPDPYLIMFMGFGFMLFYHSLQTGSRLFLFLMYISFSLGFLTKGPVAIVLPTLIIISYLILNRQFTIATIRKIMPLTGLLIFIIISFPWYCLVHISTNGEWTNGFFLTHNIGRFSNIMEGHGGSFLITSGYYAICMIPFIVFLPGIVKNTWKNRKSEIFLFSSLIILVFLIFFSISKTKLPNYALPSFPFAAIITGHFLSLISQKRIEEQVGVRIGLWILLIISLFIPIALTFGTRLEPLVAHEKDLGLWFSFMPAGIVLALYFEYKLDYYKTFTIIAGIFIVAGIVFNSILMPIIDQHNPVRTNLNLLKKAGAVKYYQTINPSFIFNYGVINKVADTNEARIYLKDTSNILITSLKAVNENPEFWENYRMAYAGKDLFDSNTTILIKGFFNNSDNQSSIP